jgi:hypothetical protein
MTLVGMIAFWWRCFYLTCCGLSPCFPIIAFALGFKSEIFLHRCLTTSGIVTANTPIQSTDESGTTITFAPVFTYRASDGRAYAVTASSSSNPPSYAMGQQVRVLYEADDPAGARIDSFGELWGFPLGFAIASLICGAIGFGVLLVKRRWIRNVAAIRA